MNKAEYDAYLRSAVWRGKRETALEAAGYACQVCNRTKNLHVHHRTYERIGGDELLADLTALCADCHNLFHKHRQVASGCKRSSTTKSGKGPRPFTAASMLRILEYLNTTPPKHNGISTGQISNALGSTKKHVRAALRHLVREGKVEQFSANRWTPKGSHPAETELEAALDRLLAAPDERGLPAQ